MRSDFKYILASNMSFIGPGMNCNSLSTKILTVDGCFQYIWGVFPPREFRNVAILFIFTLSLVMMSFLLAQFTIKI